jgi:hypothetical protein
MFFMVEKRYKYRRYYECSSMFFCELLSGGAMAKIKVLFEPLTVN